MFRAEQGGQVDFGIVGPGLIVGDNPFSLAETGGVGAVWLKTRADETGEIRVRAQHSTLGSQAIDLQARKS